MVRDQLLVVVPDRAGAQTVIQHYRTTFPQERDELSLNVLNHGSLKREVFVLGVVLADPSMPGCHLVIH